MTVYLSDTLEGELLDRVLIHEIGHCVIWSYGLFDAIRAFVRPHKQIEAEEWICNFVADYGYQIFKAAKKSLGHEAVIREFERLLTIGGA